MAKMTTNSSYDSNGDMIPDPDKQRFRRVGWIIDGGPLDGEMFNNLDALKSTFDEVPHGGYAPLYREIGTD